jgi:nucleotide-binding universal stress UspA family protein
MSLKKILVGVDFSEHSEAALNQALDIAGHVGAEVVLVHAGVVPEPAVDLSRTIGRDAGDWQQILRDRLEENRKALAALRERHEGRGVKLSQVVIDDLPDAGIAKAAEELGADLVIVGSRGNTGFTRLLLGSVAERVVRHTKTHVMVARPKSQARGGYKRILVPTDFSETAQRAFDVAAELLAEGGVIEVLHCWQLPPMAGGHYIPAPSAQVVSEMRQDLASRTEAAGERALAPLRARGITVEFRQTEAAPATAIVDTATSGSCDAIVMGSHGRRGLQRFLLGSLAETTVRYAPTSVVVVHGPAKSES